MFFTPTHTLSHLQSVRKSGRLFLSNSLAFLLVASNEMYDEKYIFYEDDLNSSHMGLSKLKTRIPTSSGNEISLFYHCNILVDRELRISTVPKSAPGRFTDFASYYDFLVNGLRGLAENANDASRCAKYRPLATISKGYDSVACAALSRQIDCEEAITFVDPADPRSDCGDEIGRRLGLGVTVYEREAYKHLADFPEAEFLSLGTRGGDVYLSAAGEQLEGSLLITGFHGDKVWEKDNKKVGTDILRGDTSGADLEEIRLRCGFIQAPVPFFGCLGHPDIHKISVSPEMTPWCIGTDYDRPIARRIAEEAGVPREWFGQNKAMMSRVVYEDKLRWYFSDSSYRDFEAYVAPHLSLLRIRGAAAFSLLRIWTVLLQTACAVLGRVSWRLQRAVGSLIPSSGRYDRGLSKFRFRFHWGMSKILQRYRLVEASVSTGCQESARD